MNLEININPEDVNKAVAEAILQSAIGVEVEKAIKAQVAKISTSYNNPIEDVIRKEIHKVVQETVRDKYSEELKTMVAEKVTEKFTIDLFSKLWESFENKY